MALDINTANTLLGGSVIQQKPNIFDLVTGKNQDITTSALSRIIPQTPNLKPIQNDSITNLENFVNENVAGDQKDLLLGQINAIKTLTEFGNDNNPTLDPVVSLLNANPSLVSALSVSNLPTGSLIDELF